MKQLEGIVIRNTGSWLEVQPHCDDAATQTACKPIQCKVKGNFRIKGIRTTNPVAVGDHVVVSLTADGTGFITSVLPRRNYIIRRATNLSKECHILAANLDQTLLVATLRNPDTPTTFIDRFLATAEAYAVPAVLVLNKADMWDTEEHELAKAIAYLYRSIGYPVVFTSAKTGEGLEEVRRLIADKVTLLAGNSGVGKSSLINALIPGLHLRTGDISTSHHTGMHTTTFSEMFALPGGGALIDIPGVKGFGTIDFDPAEVSHYFPEIFKQGAECRFQNCTHTHEPGCAVRQALDEQKIAQSRYASYLSILEDANPEKYRKPF
ncbi:MAG: ribosome small subunit-dependent GTPase A [Muribaculaceae bacterium]|nr:ribosome small subunit-dependent GTPase A [Muribaculaceae bacterium]